MRRRSFVLGLASTLVGCECSSTTDNPGTPHPAPSLTPAAQQRWLELELAPSAHWNHQQHVALLVQKEAPLLIALHGAGEAARGIVTGARGWRDDYDLDKAHQRAQAPPLVARDFHRFVKPDRLVALNASLNANPYRGLSVACPYTPALSDRSVDGARGYAAFVTSTLLPRLHQQLALKPDRKRTGIDGVSMGGRLALLVGLSHPEIFGAVGALQPAIGSGEALWISQLAKRAAAKAPLALRLCSSEGDPFLTAVETLSKQLERDGVTHQLVVTPGPHDYIWNRGPGSYEMLLWHERVLRGLPAP